MSATPARHPARHRFVTTDPEEAHNWLRAIYSDHRVQLSGNRERFLFRHTFTDFYSFSVARLQHSMEMRANTDPTEHLMIAQLLGGRFRVTAARDEIEPSLGEVFLYPSNAALDSHPNAAIDSEWEDIKVGFVRLEPDAVKRIAAEITGINPNAVRFQRCRPISAARARHWQAVVRHVTHDLLPNDAAMASPLIRTATFRLLATTLLETFPNTALGAEHSSGAAGSAVVRRAVEFIDDHAGTDIGVTEIADAARIGPRGLQQAFRRYLDTTPTAYLRRVRLEGAHRDLLAADPSRGATVADIATRWGFAHHGRFATAYRQHYGHPPSHTLHT